jgi:hypothetical protein
MAVTSGDTAALDWSIDRASTEWGEPILRSSVFAFDQTTYYEAEMGTGLQKQLIAFDRLMDPGELPACKLATNTWENEYAAHTKSKVSRPVNIDPGYLTEAKLVLATTKDREHRIYLGQGIYAEVTVAYTRKAWRCFEWTYPDFRQESYLGFWTRCRDYLRIRLADVG